jgi:prephenate dehydratase
MNEIGYLGPKGTFSDLACQRYLRGLNNLRSRACVSIDDLFESLIENKLSSILVPAENSIEGPVNLSIDRLLDIPAEYSITGEIKFPISHYLLTKKPLSLSTITDVYSHYQPLAQCQKFLKNNCPQATLHVMASSAKAAEIVSNDECHYSDNKKHCEAVIGHKDLSEVYDLTVLSKKSINDVEDNFTRFYVISKELSEETESDYTSIVVGTKKDQPGSLHEILGEFSSRNINLTQILSRPTKKELGEYLFYIECEGHSHNALVSDALKCVQKKSGFYRWLGSYPKGK